VSKLRRGCGISCEICAGENSAQGLYCDRINQKSRLIQKKGLAFAVAPEHSLKVPTSIKPNVGPFEKS
jgi:hypothetical protein